MITVLHHVLYRRTVQQSISGAVPGPCGECLRGARTDFAGRAPFAKFRAPWGAAYPVHEGEEVHAAGAYCVEVAVHACDFLDLEGFGAGDDRGVGGASRDVVGPVIFCTR